jgi:iron(III) transport system substrate-binding protein
MIILEYRGWEFVAKGAPVAVSYPTEGMGWGTDYTHLMAKAPHPNAAKLFMDFYASQEGTDALAQALGFYTARPDVPVYPEGLGRPPLSDLKLLPADPDAQTADAPRFATWYGSLFD